MLDALPLQGLSVKASHFSLQVVEGLCEVFASWCTGIGYARVHLAAWVRASMCMRGPGP